LISPVGGLCERIAEHAVALSAGGDARSQALTWLTSVGCRVDILETDESGEATSWVVDGLTGVRVGMGAGDPITMAVCLGLVLAGEFWPQVYPGLLERVDTLWRQARDRKGLARRDTVRARGSRTGTKRGPQQEKLSRPPRLL
jgi:hypothetical protein